MNLQPFLTVNWKSAKLYDKYLNAAALSYGLTRNEKDVLLFLHNNAPRDAAADIVKCRSISKSLVAKSVASLTARGFLYQTADRDDGRFVHLSITAQAMGAVHELKAAQEQFFTVFESSMSEKDRRVFMALLKQIGNHLDKHL